MLIFYLYIISLSLSLWLAGWLAAGWLTGWLAGWLADWLAGWLAGYYTVLMVANYWMLVSPYMSTYIYLPSL